MHRKKFKQIKKQDDLVEKQQVNQDVKEAYLAGKYLQRHDFLARLW